MKMLLLFSALALGSLQSQAQNVSESIERLENILPEEKKFERIVVSEDADDFVANPAAPHKVSKDKVQLYKYTDVNRVLRQTTGAYVREEDGQGLRPNIGLRGTNPDRSKKVVILEDGILAGPAPYSAPAAYYTPSMNHAQSLEIYKGFTAVPYGPNSIGGSVNYLSYDIPNGFTPTLEASAGAFNTQNYKLGIGDNSGTVGYLVQATRLSSDGFKTLDNGGFTGFEKNEITAKLKLGDFEARLGYSDEDSNETYLGLSPQDIRQSPFRRYAASALDDMTWQHTKAELQHTLKISDNTQLKSTLYRHDFERDWFRLDGFRKVSADDSKPLFEILNDPQNNLVQYQILTGQLNSQSVGAAGDLLILGNQRTFYSQGAQTQLNSQFKVGKTTHDLEVGLRFHQDQIRRTHTENIYQMAAGQMVRSPIPQTAKDLNSNLATAVTLSVLENIKWEKAVFTFLGRFEQVRFNFRNSLNNTQINRDDTVFAPGAGALYNLTPELSVKASVNRGVSVAGLNDRGTEAQEESVNYELGLKYLSQSQASVAEVVAFYNDYSNITGTCTGSTGCSTAQLDQQFNGGRALIQGIEGRVSHTFRSGAASFPIQINATALKAEFENSFSSNTAEWGLGTVNIGDPLPYIPQVQYTLSAGLEYKRFKNEFAFIYQGDSYDQSVSEGRLKVPSYGIIDWTGRYDLNQKAQLFARVDNLLGKDYVVSYRPFGARPGKPQSFMVGLSYTF